VALIRAVAPDFGPTLVDEEKDARGANSWRSRHVLAVAIEKAPVLADNRTHARK
jgi:hypothetical protein